MKYTYAISRRPEQTALRAVLPANECAAASSAPRVSFHFDDAPGQQPAAVPPDENFTQQIRPHQPRVAIIKIARKNSKRRFHIEVIPAAERAWFEHSRFRINSTATCGDSRPRLSGERSSPQSSVRR